MVNTDDYVLYKDFAHSPSKVTASVKAIAEQYPHLNSIALLELHTFSSLKKEFLPHYAGSLDAAQKAAVFINPETLAKKGNLSFSEDEIKAAFQRQDIEYLDTVERLDAYVSGIKKEGNAVIFMSSGNWGGLGMEQLLGN